jgi:WD40 repeat protein
MTGKLPEQQPSGLETPAATAGAAMRAVLEKRLENPCPQPSVPCIPDHVVLQRIGTGAYGDVWLARSTLGSLRAVKVVYRDRFDEERPFQREFHGILRYEPVSRTHQGLVAILHVGRNDEDGYFYYVMELADAFSPKGQSPPTAPSTSRGGKRGQESNPNPVQAKGVPYVPRTLRSDVAGRRRLRPVEAAGLTLQLAGALDHLHSQGLVHRDIKPSNVIFVGGQPKLADIGLVTGAGDSRSFVGTEGFIPPEGPGTPRADLYGLGKLLYELASGRDRLEFPQLPPDLTQLPEREALLELNEVITRACAPNPDQRYFTAAELAADLKLFLAGHSLRKVRKQERHLAWLKQFAMAACVLVLLALTAVWFARREALQAQSRELQSRQRADTELALRRRAEAAEQEARQQLYSALFEQARTAVHSGEVGHRVRALEALSRAAAITNAVELRREALRALALPDLRFERELVLASDATLVQLDPKFERIAVCSRTGPVEIRSTTDTRLLQTLPACASESAFVAKWSPDGRFLAVKRDREQIQENADVEVWDVPASKRVMLLTNTPYGAFDFHPTLPLITVATTRTLLDTCDLKTGLLLNRVELDHTPNFITIAPDGERLAACYEEAGGWALTINVSTNGSPLASQHFNDRLNWIQWDPKGAFIAIPDFGGSVHLFDARTGKLRLLGRHKAQAVLTAFTPDGRYLISGGWEREMICWDLNTMSEAFTINLNSFIPQISADGHQCSIANKGFVRLYSFERPSSLREFNEDLGGRLRRALFSPDGHWLAAPGQERLGLWDLTSNGPGAILPEGANTRLYFSTDGRELFASSDLNCFRWQITPPTAPDMPPRLERLLLHKPADFTSLAVASNLLAFTTIKGSQVLETDRLSLDNNAWKTTLSGVNGLCPSGRWLGVFRPYDSTLELYGLPSLQRVAELNTRFSIGTFEFSPLGDELAVACANDIEFFSTATWQRTRELTNFINVLYTPDTTALWLTRDYRTAALYDARTITPLLPLPPGMLPLAVSRDGRFFAVSVDSRRLQVWDLDVIHDEFRKVGIDWSSSPGAQAPRTTNSASLPEHGVL